MLFRIVERMVREAEKDRSCKGTNHFLGACKIIRIISCWNHTVSYAASLLARAGVNSTWVLLSLPIALFANGSIKISLKIEKMMKAELALIHSSG
jgi:hypothetical protein